MLRLLRRFLLERKGSFAVITAVAAIPMFFLVGMGIDYGWQSTAKRI